jgi:hypothetical protein
VPFRLLWWFFPQGNVPQMGLFGKKALARAPRGGFSVALELGGERASSP